MAIESGMSCGGVPIIAEALPKPGPEASAHPAGRRSLKAHAFVTFVTAAEMVEVRAVRSAPGWNAEVLNSGHKNSNFRDALVAEFRRVPNSAPLVFMVRGGWPSAPTLERASGNLACPSCARLAGAARQSPCLSAKSGHRKSEIPMRSQDVWNDPHVIRRNFRHRQSGHRTWPFPAVHRMVNGLAMGASDVLIQVVLVRV